MDQYRTSSGFALPTVIITSVILFAVLVAVMSTVSSVRSTLNTQYNQALARDAAESGIAYAKYCYSVNAGTTNNTEWPKATTGDGATLDSGDDCTGKPQSGSNCDSTSPADVCFVAKNDNVKTRFSVNQPVANGVSYSFSSTGNTDNQSSPVQAKLPPPTLF